MSDVTWLVLMLPTILAVINLLVLGVLVHGIRTMMKTISNHLEALGSGMQLIKQDTNNIHSGLQTAISRLPKSRSRKKVEVKVQ